MANIFDVFISPYIKRGCVYFKKSLSEDFGKLPNKKETNGFTWDVPK